MASPQKENGFTPIAHEILEEVVKRKFTATQLNVLMVVWRMTYGFNRKDHELSVSFFVNSTGFSKRNVQEAINQLIEMNVLIETKKASFNQTRKIAFNKNYDEWKVISRTKSNQMNQSSPVEEEVTSPDEPEFTSPDEPEFTQERNIKEILKKEEEEENPITLYEKNFYPLTPTQMEILWQWVDDFNGNKEVICQAIKETALKNPKVPFRYLERILNDWYRRELFTVDDVMKEKRRYEQSKIIQYPSNKKRSLFDQGEESRRRQAAAEARAEMIDDNELRKMIEEMPY